MSRKTDPVKRDSKFAARATRSQAIMKARADYEKTKKKIAKKGVRAALKNADDTQITELAAMAPAITPE